jgi:hypothetical protein
MLNTASFWTFAGYLVGMSAILFVLAFWFAMVRDNLQRNEGYSKYTWTLLILCIPFVGAAAYFFTARRALLQKENAE